MFARVFKLWPLDIAIKASSMFSNRESAIGVRVFFVRLSAFAANYQLVANQSQAKYDVPLNVLALEQNGGTEDRKSP